jgi:hypothetical protein
LSWFAEVAYVALVVHFVTLTRFSLDYSVVVFAIETLLISLSSHISDFLPQEALGVSMTAVVRSPGLKIRLSFICLVNSLALWLV